MSDPTNPDPAMTRPEIQRLIGRFTGVRPSPSTTYRLLAKGKIPAFRLSEGGPLYARRSDVEAFAKSRMATGVGPRESQASDAIARIRAMCGRMR
jgi:hypothetical protein